MAKPEPERNGSTHTLARAASDAAASPRGTPVLRSSLSSQALVAQYQQQLQLLQLQQLQSPSSDHLAVQQQQQRVCPPSGASTAGPSQMHSREGSGAAPSIISTTPTDSQIGGSAGIADSSHEDAVAAGNRVTLHLPPSHSTSSTPPLPASDAADRATSNALAAALSAAMVPQPALQPSAAVEPAAAAEDHEHAHRGGAIAEGDELSAYSDGAAEDDPDGVDEDEDDDDWIDAEAADQVEGGGDDYDAETDGMPSDSAGGLTSLSTEDSLAELDLVKMSRWSLQFENPKMESIFIKHFLLKLQKNYLRLHGIVVMQHVFLGAVEVATGTTESILLPIVLCRGIIVALFAVSALSTLAQECRERRERKRIEREERAQAQREEEEQQRARANQAMVSFSPTASPQKAPRPVSAAAGYGFAASADPQIEMMEMGGSSSAGPSANNTPERRRRELNAGAGSSSPVGASSHRLSFSHAPREESQSVLTKPPSPAPSDEDSSSDSSDAPSGEARLYLLRVLIVLNSLQGIVMLVAFTLASRATFTDDAGGEMEGFTAYTPSAGELSTAFSLLLYGFIFVGSGMLLIHALPISVCYFAASLIIAAALDSPWRSFLSSIVLQAFFLVLGAWNQYAMERQTRKELILLCTVARDRARGNDLINNMLPPSMVLRLQMMQQKVDAEQAEAARDGAGNIAAGGGALEEVEDETGNIVLRHVATAATTSPEDEGGDGASAGSGEIGGGGGGLASPSGPGSLVSLNGGGSSAGSVSPLPLLSGVADSSLLSSSHFYDVYDNVSILFCYISSFTELVVALPPEALVRLLNEIYSAFDDSILTCDGMYKVEAIAETYMAVSGCPFVNPRHGATVADFALNMLEIIARNLQGFEATLEQQMEIKRQTDAKEQAAAHHRSPSRRARSIGGMAAPRTPILLGSTQNRGSQALLALPPPLVVAPAPARPTVAIQIGVHSGPIAAGVIGTKTLSYHLFGQYHCRRRNAVRLSSGGRGCMQQRRRAHLESDTLCSCSASVGDAVNTASRMCSTGSPNSIQCSAATARLIEDQFELENLGVKQVKGKGAMNTYSIKSKHSRADMKRRAAALAAANAQASANLDAARRKGLTHSASQPRMETTQQEAARHAVDSFQAIVNINDHPHPHTHHRSASMSPSHAQLGAEQKQQHLFPSPSKRQPSSPRAPASPASLASGGGGGAGFQADSQQQLVSSHGGGSGLHVRTSSAISSILSPSGAMNSASPTNGSGSGGSSGREDHAQLGSPMPVSPSFSQHSASWANAAPATAAGSSSSDDANNNSSSGRGTASNLQFVAEFPASSWSLRLYEPTLEEEFHAVYLVKSVRHLRVLVPLLLILAVMYLIAGSTSIPSEQLKYFLPQCAATIGFLAGLGYILWHAAPCGSAASGPSAAAAGASYNVPSRAMRLFHRFDQALIAATISGVLISVNMSGLYTPAGRSLSSSTSSVPSAGESGGSLVSNYASLVNFNILALMAVFFVLRLYYRWACLVACVVFVDLVVVFGVGGASLRGELMSLAVIAVCTVLSGYAQYHREYTMKFDFLLERVLLHEKNQLFQLLQNMLPSPAHALKLMTGMQVIESQNCVSILMSDIKGFTSMATTMLPQDLCTLLNSFYSAFDEHLDVRGVYKIDTIGDAFVVVGGLAIENSTVDHASAIADFALDMLGEIEHIKAMWRLLPSADPQIQQVTMRIGVHTGRVIAATLGLIRPKYLLFGTDTLIANKMESEGIPGQIQLSQSTFDLLSPLHTHLMEPREVLLDLGPKFPEAQRMVQTFLLKGRFQDILRAARERGAMQAASKASEEAQHLAVAADSATAAAVAATAAGDASDDDETSGGLRFHEDTEGSSAVVVPPAAGAAAASTVAVSTDDVDADEHKDNARPLIQVTAPAESSTLRRRNSMPQHSRNHSRVSESADDTAVVTASAQPGSRAVRLLSKQIAHVRGLSRENFNFTPAQFAELAATHETNPSAPHGTQLLLAAPRASSRRPSSHAATSSARGSVLLSSTSEAPEASMAQASDSSSVASQRSPHRRSFTALIDQPRLTAPAVAASSTSGGHSPATGSIPPPVRRLSVATGMPPGLPPISPHLPAALLGRTESAETGSGRPRLDSPAHVPTLRVHRSFSTEHDDRATRPGSVAASSGGVSPAGSDEAMVLSVPSPRPASAVYSPLMHMTDPLFLSNPATPSPVLVARPSEVHRRKSSISFQRGIALHHRRSTSVISSPLVLMPGGLAQRSPAGGATPAAAAGHSRVPSMNTNSPLLTGAAATAAASSDSPTGASAAASSALRARPSLKINLSPALGAATSTRPPSRRHRDGGAPSPPRTPQIEEEPAAPTGDKAVASPRNGKGRRAHGRSATSLIAPAAVAPDSAFLSVASGAASVGSSRKSSVARRPQVRRTATVPHGASSAAAAVSSDPTAPLAASQLPTSFDDTSVEIKTLRAEHESDLDGLMNASQVAQLTELEQQVWQSKLQMLAHRRAAVQQSEEAHAAAAASAAIALTSPGDTSSPEQQQQHQSPLALFVNDERVSATATPIVGPSSSGTPAPSANASGWSGLGPLSPVLDMSPQAGDSPASPLTNMLEQVDASLAAEAAAAASVSGSRQPSDDASPRREWNAPPLSSASSSSQNAAFGGARSFAFDSTAAAAASGHAHAPPLSASSRGSGGDPSRGGSAPGSHRSSHSHAAGGSRHSRSSSRMHDHLDMLHSLQRAAGAGPSSNLESPSVGAIQALSSGGSPFRPGMLNMPRSSPTSSNAPSKSTSPAPPNSQAGVVRTNSGSGLREPLARDQIEAEIFSGSIVGYAAPTPAPLSARRSESSKHSSSGPRTHSGGAGGAGPSVSNSRRISLHTASIPQSGRDSPLQSPPPSVGSAVPRLSHISVSPLMVPSPHPQLAESDGGPAALGQWGLPLVSAQRPRSRSNSLSLSGQRPTFHEQESLPSESLLSAPVHGRKHGRSRSHSHSGELTVGLLPADAAPSTAVASSSTLASPIPSSRVVTVNVPTISVPSPAPSPDRPPRRAGHQLSIQAPAASQRLSPQAQPKPRSNAAARVAAAANRSRTLMFDAQGSSVVASASSPHSARPRSALSQTAAAQQQALLSQFKLLAAMRGLSSPPVSEPHSASYHAHQSQGQGEAPNLKPSNVRQVITAAQPSARGAASPDGAAGPLGASSPALPTHRPQMQTRVASSPLVSASSGHPVVPLSTHALSSPSLSSLPPSALSSLSISGGNAGGSGMVPSPVVPPSQFRGLSVHAGAGPSRSGGAAHRHHPRTPSFGGFEIRFKGANQQQQAQQNSFSAAAVAAASAASSAAAAGSASPIRSADNAHSARASTHSPAPPTSPAPATGASGVSPQPTPVLLSYGSQPLLQSRPAAGSGAGVGSVVQRVKKPKPAGWKEGDS